MKKKILTLILLNFILIGCGPKDRLIDSDFLDPTRVSILGEDKTFGDQIHVEDGDHDFSIDVEGMNPWKVQICNVDGGEREVALGVYKESPHHKEMAKRVFLYNIDYENQRLKPKIRISRLNNPLEDFIMVDIDEDGLDNILALEKLKDGSYQLAAYKWTNFSFDRPYASDKFSDDLVFVDKNGRVEVNGVEMNLYIEGGKILWK